MCGTVRSANTVGVQVRHVDHLLVVECGRARVGRDGVHGRGRAVEPQPVGCFAFGVQLDAVVCFAAFLLEAVFAGARSRRAKLSAPAITLG